MREEEEYVYRIDILNCVRFANVLQPIVFYAFTHNIRILRPASCNPFTLWTKLYHFDDFMSPMCLMKFSLLINVFLLLKEIDKIFLVCSALTKSVLLSLHIWVPLVGMVIDICISIVFEKSYFSRCRIPSYNQARFISMEIPDSHKTNEYYETPNRRSILAL